MNTISLKLPDALLRLIEEEARGRRITKSKVIRDCVEEKLIKPKRGRKQSCYDLARHLAGSLRGPRDIATHPAYLKDFGK